MSAVTVACLDLEGVLVPEIWIAVAERTGVPELRRTTRDEPDYDKLMRWRLGAQVVRLAGDARVVFAHGRTIGPLVALSLASQLLLCLSVAALARAIGAPLAALDSLIVMPIVLVLLVLFPPLVTVPAKWFTG